MKMSDMKLRINISYVDIVFYFSWIFYSVIYTLLSSEYTALVNLTAINKLTQYIVILALASCFFIPKIIVKNKYLRVVIMLMSVAIILMKNPNKNFLIIILFMITARYINFECFIKRDFALKLTLFIFIVLSCAFGIINNYTPVINNSQKMSFGFGHPNVYCFYLFVIILEYMYIQYKKIGFKQIFTIFILFISVYLTGAARTSSISFFIVFFLYIFAKKKVAFVCGELMTFLYILGFVVVIIFSFVSVYLYMDGSSIMYELNKIITGRLYLAAEFLKLYDINLFGNEVVTLGARAAKELNEMPMILDNSYIRCVLFYGLVFSLVLVFLYIKKIVYYAKKLNPQWLCITLFFIISGFAESYFINIFYNITLLSLLKNDEFNVFDHLNRWLRKKKKIRCKRWRINQI